MYTAYIESPINNHTKKYNEDSDFAENLQYIRSPQVTIPNIGNQGQNGTLKGLSLCGSVLRRIKTAKQIIIKEVNVQKLHNSDEIFKSINKAHTITTNPDNQVNICGVLYFL